MHNPDLLALIEQAHHILLAKQLRVATAESCTGGFLAQILTALPGSSSWFDCGVVTYSNESKQKLLDVPAEIIDKHGAVSEPVAIAMAQGILQISNADLSIAITGIAGPTGGNNDKPVGTVWFAWQLRHKDTITRCTHFSGDRDLIRTQAVATALEMILSL